MIVAAVAFVAGGAALIPTGASASDASLPPGFQITVTESRPNMVFGEPSPSFRIEVTVPPDDTPPTNVQRPVFLLVDGSRVANVGDVTGLSNSFFLPLLPASPPLSVGQHSVAAMYASPTFGDLTGPAITLTVEKATPVLQCGIANPTPTFAPGASVTIGTTFSNVNIPVGFQDGTFSLTFSGAQTFTVDGLKADGSGNLVATLPSVPGSYEGTCSFSGTSSVNAVQARLDNGVPVIVSTNRAIGGIKLSTEPAVLTSNVTMTWHVTVLPGPGLPAPTGFISIRLGAQFTPIIALSDGGSVTFTTTPTSFNGVTAIKVFYDGDPVYAPSSASFPLDNPAPASPGPTGSVPSLAVAPGPPAPPMTGAEPGIEARGQAPGPGAIGLLALIALGLALGGLWLRRRNAVAIKIKG
jgi:hypothetical protein